MNLLHAVPSPLSLCLSLLNSNNLLGHFYFVFLRLLEFCWIFFFWRWFFLQSRKWLLFGSEQLGLWKLRLTAFITAKRLCGVLFKWKLARLACFGSFVLCRRPVSCNKIWGIFNFNQLRFIFGAHFLLFLFRLKVFMLMRLLSFFLNGWHWLLSSSLQPHRFLVWIEYLHVVLWFLWQPWRAIILLALNWLGVCRVSFLKAWFVFFLFYSRLSQRICAEFIWGQLVQLMSFSHCERLEGLGVVVEV